MCSPWEAQVRLHTVVKPQPRLDKLLGDSQTPALLDTRGTDHRRPDPPVACEAAIIPMGLGAKSKILDLVRRKRHHSYAHNPKYEMKTIPNGRVIFSRS